MAKTVGPFTWRNSEWAELARLTDIVQPGAVLRRLGCTGEAFDAPLAEATLRNVVMIDKKIWYKIGEVKPVYLNPSKYYSVDRVGVEV